MVENMLKFKNGSCKFKKFAIEKMNAEVDWPMLKIIKFCLVISKSDTILVKCKGPSNCNNLINISVRAPYSTPTQKSMEFVYLIIY
jgi:hypothetical protein